MADRSARARTARDARPHERVASLPLWSPDDPARLVMWRNGVGVSLAELSRDVAALARDVPQRAAMINLCDDRYRFLVAYAAALACGQTVLLPPSRADQVVADVERAHGAAWQCDDARVAVALEKAGEPYRSAPRVALEQVAMIGYTSGSTGLPKANPKRWSELDGGTARNLATIRAALGLPAKDVEPLPWIVATVPPQHMYGMEFTVLLPLLGGMAVHGARPLFPADVAAALMEVPEPRVLVSTPLHLRMLVESEQLFPRAALVVSATAPLDAALAGAVERRLGGRVLEVFGSTETGVIAQRHTPSETAWRLYPGVTLQSMADGTLVRAPWFAAPALLPDHLEVVAPGRFVLRGRSADLIEVAGKRASLADLTRRLQAVEGVRDAAVFQPDEEGVARVRRVAAVAVAPGLSAAQVLARLAPLVDPAFMPRPLILVEAMPRNELGKLPRAVLLRLLRGGGE